MYKASPKARALYLAKQRRKYLASVALMWAFFLTIHALLIYYVWPLILRK